ncbi:MAG: thermonuclease family protein [Actinomycetota bacterium]|nr:thermonuclease family protein [Actinomycetota bacterium]
MGRTLRFGPTGRGGLVGIVFFLVVVAAALGGCGDTASSPVEEGEQARGVEEVAQPRGEPKPRKPETETPREEAEAAPPPAPAAPEPEPPAPTVAASDPDDGEGVQYESTTPAAYDATATVARVVDGDTIEISPAIDGVTDVRLIGVDTPETKEPGCVPQPYGAEASSYAESILSGQEVELEFDVEKTDQYGRLLAYVYPEGGEMFNEDLVEEGLAQAYPYPPNTRYADRFAAAQAQASAAGLGIWSLGPDGLALLTDRGNGIGGDGCASLAPEPQAQYESAPASSVGQQPAGQPSGGGGSVAPITESDCPPTHPVKGNQSGIYHVPGGGYYDVTNPEECFATGADAEAAGYRASKV